MRPILTAAAMRAAEQAAIDAGTPVETLMERAGAALAEAAHRYTAGMPALVLCGPGNNGGDGQVAARRLRERGVAVRVAMLGDLDPDTEPAPLLIDCLFGTGLKRPLEPAVAKEFSRLAAAARVTIACDLPSGVETDSGAMLGEVPQFDMTVAFGALKPAHR